MQARGYKIIPVNPKAAGGEILGEKAYASLAEIPFPIDIVNVYRRSEFLPDVARDFLKADAKIFWAQLGLESLEAEEILRAGGCDDIVMNRCIKREHTRLILEHKKVADGLPFVLYSMKIKEQTRKLAAGCT